MRTSPSPRLPTEEPSRRAAVLNRYGGDWQPSLDNFDDAVAALALPDTAWAVLSCPIDGMDLDANFVALIDRDADGRVRTDDVREAVAWTASMLCNLRGVTEGVAQLRVDDLTELAGGHRDTALALTAALGHDDSVALTLADLRNTEALCQCGDRDGDGVVPVHCLPPELQAAAESILSVCPAEQALNGNLGVTRAVLEQFATERDAAIAWFDEEQGRSPWGEATVDLARSLVDCDSAVQAWFSLSKLVVVDPASAQIIEQGSAEHALRAPVGQDPARLAALLDELPLASPDVGGFLTFECIRPGSRHEALLALRDAVFDRAASLSAGEWDAALTTAHKIVAWENAGSLLVARPLGVDVLRGIGNHTLNELRLCCELDERNRQYFTHLHELEKLLVYQRDLFRFCRNFIAFTDLMDPNRRALFERGTLILDGRTFHFAMRVRDIKRHKARAELSGIFVLYVQVAFRREASDAPTLETVAVPVTRGTSAGLGVHRRGVFVDRDGHYHEALVVGVVENPVSFTEALLTPFGRVGQYLSGKLEKLTQKLDGDFDKQVTDISKLPAAPPPAPGMNPLMGGTIAFAALGSAFAFITKQLSEIGGPRILIALVILSALVAIPTVLVASVRLYRRNLAGLIAASDWALNDRMRLTASLGRLFTRRPALPAKVVAATRDRALEQLARIDPSAVWKERVDMTVRTVMLATMTTLLLTLAVPAGRFPWLDLASWGAGALHLAMLAAVLVTYLRTRRFRRVYWWPVLTAFPVTILVTVHFLTRTAVSAL
jgi:hypothetical protein